MPDRRWVEPRVGTVLVVLTVLAWSCDGPARPLDSGTPDGGGQDGGDAADAGRDGAVADGGSDAGPPEVAPLFRNAVDLSDEELATQALRLMGVPEVGGSGSCTSCHTIDRPSVRHYWDLSDAAWRTCFSDLEVTTREAAQGILECFRTEGAYAPSRLGVFATGADFAWFQFVFRRALGDDAWEAEYEQFRTSVLMPPDEHPTFTQEEFDLLTEWFLRGTPWVENALPSRDATGECTSYVDASVVAMVDDGEATGWPARNREAAILMHDCAGAASPLECLSSYPLSSEVAVGAGWEVPGTEQRVLFDVPYRTSYWTKVSADGRFVAHGGGNGTGASFIDLSRGIVIGANALYDPGFFPDNSGFMIQGASGTPSTAFCMQTLLTTSTGPLTFYETGCSRAGGIALYQHVGASLDGGDYWVVTSDWEGDPGDATRDPNVRAARRGELTLHRLLNTGSGFAPAGSTSVPAPWQGNAVVSPTMRLMVTQLARSDGRPLGYVLRRIDITRRADGSVQGIVAPEVARYCTPGSKAAMSLDDRWITTHHRMETDEDAIDLGFTGVSDPGFAPYMGVSNVYLIDVITGERTRVTNMQPGQRALFPSFRSDGWLYYLVRSGPSGSLPEHIVASNAGIVWR